ncbi:RNA polymerase III regulator protein (Maf1), putative [Bodo saltans]|uniref:RNA polymerase III regulator protein (Maf1), putative n=1 Tax=Bodo saltans TaxID=75058 RepID=A0A0S4JIA8_BODSA|nr:RNA polymerase III regulator protein (Maf1), putative [Bodo saltans]|eukprot:CUG89901.1 RNA polymerase III regulator protein (Maf1), putative [Bodo saltans]
MKFIPSVVFERMNSLLQGIEAQGSLLTVRCEAYTCRHTKEEKQLAATITDRRQQQGIVSGGGVGAVGSVSPILQPSAGGYIHGHFPAMEGLPPPMVVGGGPSSPSVVESPQSVVDDRLIFLVAALNAIFGDGYDFSCLEESDFDLLDPLYVKAELENVLASVPADSAASSVIGLPFQHETFWAAIADVAFGDRSLVPALFDSSVCDYFLFKCPSCDPMQERSVWSNHVLMYCKKQRILVSILAYGEGNMYRGDDGVTYVRSSGTVAGGLVSPSSRVVGGEFYFDGDTTHYLRPSSAGGSAVGDDYSQATSVTDHEDNDGGGDVSMNKNRDFYGF